MVKTVLKGERNKKRRMKSMIWFGVVVRRSPQNSFKSGYPLLGHHVNTPI